MDSSSTICAVIVIIILGIGFTAGYILLKKLIYTGVDSAVDAIRNNNARNREAANPPQQQSLAEKYGMQGTSSQQPALKGINDPPSFEKKNVAPNQWQCPKCGAVNPRYVGTCGCGFLLSEIEEYERKQKEAIRQRMEQDRIKREEEQKIYEDERNKLLAQNGQVELSSTQEFALKVIAKKQGLSLAEICKMLPRSMNLSDFKEALNVLLEKGLIRKDENEKYYLIKSADTNKKDKTDDVICLKCGRTQKKNQLGCIYCHADVANLVSAFSAEKSEEEEI